MKNKSIVILSIITTLLIIVTMIVAINVNSKKVFAKPEFDINATEITDNIIDEKYKYAEANIQEGYVIGLCNNLIVDEQGNIKIYFTSLNDNKVYVKLRIYDKENNLLAETGLLKPGERLENIKVDNIKKDTEVIIKIMSYDPETYYSMGTVTLNSEIIVGEI